MNAKFGQVVEEIDTVSGKFDSLEGKFDELHHHLTRQEPPMSNNPRDRINLTHLTFEEAVSALAKVEEPTRKDSQAGESGSTTEAAPEPDPSER